MSWLSLILSLVDLVGKITQYLHDRALINSGGAAAIAAALEGQSNDLKRLIQIKDDAGKRFDDAAHAGRLPDDFESRD